MAKALGLARLGQGRYPLSPRAGLALAGWLTFAAVGCGNEPRHVVTLGQSKVATHRLGEAVYEAVCSRVAQPQDGSKLDVSGALTEPICRGQQPPPADAPAALWALHNRRADFVAAIDTVFAPEHQAALKGLLARMLPLHDDGSLRQLARLGAQALRGLAQDDTVLQGLQRLSWRQGYTPADVSLLSAAFDGPELAVLVPALASAAASHPDLWQALGPVLSEAPEALHLGLVTDVAQLLEAWVQPLWAPRAGAAPTPATNEPNVTLVLRDRSGHAVRSPHTAVEATTSLTPFARPGVLETPLRGSRDIARAPDGLPLYLYRATTDTLLAQMVSFAGAWAAAKPRASACSGPKALQRALDALAAEPTAELEAQAHAAFVMMQRLWPMRGKLAALGYGLLTEAEPQVVEAARAWTAAVAAAAAVAPPPRAASHAARDALLVHLAEWLSQLVAKPDLAADVFAALAHPDSALLAPEIAAQMAHIDAIDFDPTNINAPVLGRLVTPTSAEHPHSTFSRLLALVQGARGARLCSAPLEEPMPQYERCALFEVPCIATFYLDTLASAAELTLHIDEDDFFFPDQFAGAQEDAPDKSEMEAFTGIDGFVRVPGADDDNPASNALTFNVNSKAASRLLFALHDTRVPQDSAFGRSRAGVQQVTPRLTTHTGEAFDEVFRGTVFAWETEAFALGVRPVVQAFVAHGAQAQLLDLLDVLHQHWPALLAEDAHFERRLAYLLGDGRLPRAMSELLQALGRGPVVPWPWLTAAVAAGVTDDGSGTSPVARALAARDSNDAACMTALSADADMPLIMRALLGPADGQAGNVHLRPVLQAWLEAAQKCDETPHLPISFDARVWLKAPAVRPSAALASTLMQNAHARDAALQLGARLFAGGGAPGLTAAADAAQMLPDVPQLWAFGKACAHHVLNGTRAMPLALDVAQRLLGPDGLDTDGAVVALLQRLVRVPRVESHTPPQGSPWSTLSDIALQLGRQNPNVVGPLQAADFAQTFAAVADFMDDDQHGLVRLFDLIAARHGEQASAVLAP